MEKGLRKERYATSQTTLLLGWGKQLKLGMAGRLRGSGAGLPML